MIDLSNVPGVVTIENKGTKDVQINLSGYNQSFTLPASESVKLKVNVSSELVGFLSQETDTLKVTLPTAADDKGTGGN